MARIAGPKDEVQTGYTFTQLAAMGACPTSRLSPVSPSPALPALPKYLFFHEKEEGILIGLALPPVRSAIPPYVHFVYVCAAVQREATDKCRRWGGGGPCPHRQSRASRAPNPPRMESSVAGGPPQNNHT